MFSSIMKILRTFILFILLFSISVSYAQMETGSFDFDGITRGYGVFLPENYTGTTNSPLVIYLHSYGWTPLLDMNYTALNTVADTSGFIVAYPGGNPNWNSGIGDSPSWPTPNNDDVGFINAMLDTLSNNYSINLDRVYACGFSNGGFMAYKVACQLSHRIAAIASVSGVISNSTKTNCNPLRPMPVLHIHGTSDTFVPINGKGGWNTVDQTLGYWTNFNNCVQVDTTILPDLDPSDGCTVEKISYTDCTNNSNIIYYKVIDGGHSWPNATQDPSWAQPRNMDINANVEILNFFKNYELGAPLESVEESIVKDFHLMQNYPNPFNPTTTIHYTLPEESLVNITIYDMLGTKVSEFISQNQFAGNHSIQWNGKDINDNSVCSGIYFYQIRADEFVQTKKMVLTK